MIHRGGGDAPSSPYTAVRLHHRRSEAPPPPPPIPRSIDAVRPRSARLAVDSHARVLSPQFLSDDHPLQKSITILNTKFPTATEDRGLGVYFNWGVDLLDTSGVNLLIDPEYDGKMKWKANFFTEECQVHGARRAGGGQFSSHSRIVRVCVCCVLPSPPARARVARRAMLARSYLR